jgi:Flp pilus assembly protein TadD
MIIARTRPLKFLNFALAMILLTGCSNMWSARENLQTDSVTRLANTMRDQGNYQMAVQFYNRAIEVAPEKPEPYLELARIYQAQGMNDDAVKYYQQAFVVSSEPAKIQAAQFDCARLLIQLNRAAEAEAVYTAIVTEDGNNVKALNGLGVALDMQNKHTEAQEQYRKALREDVSNITSMNNLAHSLTLSGDPTAAIALLEPMANGPQATPLIKNNLAEAYAAIGDKRAAQNAVTTESSAAAPEITAAPTQPVTKTNIEQAPSKSAEKTYPSKKQQPAQNVITKPKAETKKAEAIKTETSPQPSPVVKQAQEKALSQVMPQGIPIDLEQDTNQPAAPVPDISAAPQADLGSFDTPGMAQARIAAIKAALNDKIDSDIKLYTHSELSPQGTARLRAMASGFETIAAAKDFCATVTVANFDCLVMTGKR